MMTRRLAYLPCLIEIAALCLIQAASAAPQAFSKEKVTNNVSLGAPGELQLYFFTQSWTQEFCAENSDLPPCHQTSITNLTHLTLHGLWPQNSTSKGYPQFCNNSPGCITQSDSSIPPCPLDWDSLPATLQSFLESSIPVNAKDLADHEWEKHGTCSGLNQEGYFSTIQKIFNSMPTPEIIKNNIGKSISYQDLQNAYEFQILLQCAEDSNYLQSVVSCWDKEAQNQISCAPYTTTNINNCATDQPIQIRKDWPKQSKNILK